MFGTLATGAAALPMAIAGGVLAFQRPDVVPDGDFAVDEIALMRATYLAQLVGNYSRYAWNHIGPAWFYALGVIYAPLGQQSWAFFAAALALHALAACLIVIVAWRIRGPALAAIAAALLLWFIFKLGLPTFSTAWPPYETILPIILFLLLVAFGAAGSTLALVGALLVGSYEAQLHVGTMPTVAIALVVMALVRIAPHRWRAAGRPFSDIRGRPLLLALVAIGLITLVAMWVPVAVDQLTGRPGNLTKLANFFFFAHLPHHALREGVSALGRHLSVFPLGHPPPGNEYDYSMLTLKRVLVVGGFLALSGALAVAGIAIRDRFAESVGIVLFLVTVGLVWSVSRVVGELWSYFLLWTTTLPVVLMVGWATLLIKMAPAAWLPRSLSSIRARALAAAVAAVLVVLAAVQTVGFLQVRSQVMDFNPGTRAATALVEASLSTRPREPVLVTIVGLDAWPAAAGVSLQLIKHGWPVSIRPEYQFMFGDQMRASGRERVELIFVPESGLAQFDQHAPGLRFVGAVPTCTTGCTLSLFTRTPSALP